MPDRDEVLKSLEEIKNAVGPTDPKPHVSGYLSADEYATLVYYWAGEAHEADVVEGVILALANQPWAWAQERALQTAAAVEALEELYPGKRQGWRQAHTALYVLVNQVMADTPLEDSAWDRYYLIRWFFLRRARRDEGIEILDKLLDRVADGGQVGWQTRQVIAGAAKDCKPFQIAIQNAIAERAKKMIVQLEQ